MKRYQIMIKQSNMNNSMVKVPKSLYPDFQNIHSISFGTKRSDCTVTGHSAVNEPDTIFISKDIWDHLRLPFERNIHIFCNDEAICIGPLIGIFTAGFTRSLLRPLGTRTLFFAQLLEAEKMVGTFTFVFGRHHIDWEKGTISGLFHTNEGWVEREVPFPNVIYDRLPNRKTENLSVLQEVKTKLQNDYLIPWFNPGFFDKWEIYSILSQYEAIRPYLPETYYKPTVDKIKEMLHTHHNVFIKPIRGSLGLGIYQLLYSKRDNAYYCRYRKDETNYLQKFHTFEALTKQVLSAEMLANAIVQQGIYLLRHEKRPVDLRIHTNKNENGIWEMSAIAFKIAGSGSVTTHIHSGGQIKTIEEMFSDENTRQDILKRMKELTFTISNILDLKIDGYLGELGFDIGIDKHHNIWLFEVNSKPGRSIFKHVRLKESDSLSKALPLKYALYLTEQTIKQQLS